jgi:uncharacterized membrane protein YpjA
MYLFHFLQELIKQRWVLWSLLIINGLGTIYGYYWYRNQIAITPAHLLPFVPDSPTASLFFTLVLLFLLIGIRTSFIAAFAAVTSIKYGIWAVVAILWGQALGDQLAPEHYMLIVSHLGMAVEAVLFYKYYRIHWVHLFAVAAWTLFNDFLDYILDIHPWTAEELEPYHTQLGWFTLSLSLFSILLVIFLVQLQRKQAS